MTLNNPRSERAQRWRDNSIGIAALMLLIGGFWLAYVCGYDYAGTNRAWDLRLSLLMVLAGIGRLAVFSRSGSTPRDWFAHKKKLGWTGLAVLGLWAGLYIVIGRWLNARG